MPTQLDEVCNKYGFKKLNVATWRDPNLSVLAGGRGPRAGVKILPADAYKPFVPTYKVTYRRPPEPTDDEDSGTEADAPIEETEQAALGKIALQNRTAWLFTFIWNR